MNQNEISHVKQELPASKKNFSQFRIIPGIFCIALYVILSFLPVPEGLTLESWRFFAFFCASILGIILKVMSIGAMSLVIISLGMITQIASPTPAKAVQDMLISMNNPLIWLIVVSIIIAQGLIKTGLGSRIGYYFISFLGQRTLGIGYGLAFCELILAPFTPSNTARGGGIIHPIMRSIAHAFGSDPEKKTENKIGTYLALVNYHSNPITSAMFVTATAPNPLVLNYISQATNSNLHLSWGEWALCMLVPGLVAILSMPFVIYFLSPPEIKKTPDAVIFAQDSLKKLGKISFSEILMLVTFLIMLMMWAGLPEFLFGASFSFNPTSVAFFGLMILLITGVLTWDDVLKQKSAWDTLIWFGALIMMATQLNNLGVIHWFSDHLRETIEKSGMSWPFVMFVLIATFMYTHYFFASTTAHISAMMLAFLTVGTHLIPQNYINLFIFLMVASSSIMMTLTHYATGTSPIVFGSGYVTLKKWWIVGLCMSIINMIIFAIIGGVWWKILGYW